MFRGYLLCFSLCPLTLVLSLGNTEKSLAPSPLHSATRYLYTQMRFPPEPSLLQTEQLIFSYKRCSRPLITFMALCWTLSSVCMSLLWARVQNWTHTGLIQFTLMSKTITCNSQVYMCSCIFSESLSSISPWSLLLSIGITWLTRI